jgi:hypothetical protein
MSKSVKLSSRLTRIGGGSCLTKDSSESEHALINVMRRIVEYAKTIKLKDEKYEVMWRPTVSLYECQVRMKSVYGDDYPEPSDYNTSRSMRTDGGIVYIIDKTTLEWCPILITEDKIQGTNDHRFIKGLGRQASGNAIERAAKNIRGMEMLMAGQERSYFPYVIFASGCDFHKSESIAQRLEMMNYGMSNFVFDVTESSTNIMHSLTQKLRTINCKKKWNDKCVASVFIKTHKWNKAVHGTSNWNDEERYSVCKWVIDQTIQPYSS